jgi:tRNA nucleotidyltransferase (CCA-adding enzyme)
MLEALERGLRRFNVDFYLVGAVARDVWMRAIHDITS